MTARVVGVDKSWKTANFSASPTQLLAVHTWHKVTTALASIQSLNIHILLWILLNFVTETYTGTNISNYEQNISILFWAVCYENCFSPELGKDSAG